MSRKAKVLEVATRLFAAKGFEGASVRRIAEEAGLSVAGMFYYFPSKEAILYEIMIGFMDAGLQRLQRICRGQKDPIAKLEEICRFYAEYYAGHKQQLTILVSEGKSLSDEHREVFKEKQRQYLDLLRGLFRDLAKQGVLKEIDTTVLAFLLFGMVHWTFSWYDPKGKVGPSELGNILSEVFLRGVLKDREKGGRDV